MRAKLYSENLTEGSHCGNGGVDESVTLKMR
jgi:hypothetical protein